MWENSNSTAPISAGDRSPINGINLADYDEFEIYASTSGTYRETMTCKIAGDTDKGNLLKLVLGNSFINSILYSRTIKITKSTNIIHIDTCYKNANTSSDDSYLIPFAIYGIKY